jgi:Rod binding domain-containing protein
MDISLDPSMVSSEQMISKLKNLRHAGENQGSKEELKRVANDFEEILVNFLVKAMWKTIPDSGLHEESKAMGMYTDIMQSALSEEITRMGGLGVAQSIYDEMEKSLILGQNKGEE